jgi:collagen type VII alpha
MTTISNLPRVSSLSDQTLFIVTENGVSKVVTWAFIRSTSTGYIGSRGSTGFQGSIGYVGSRGAGFAGSQGPIGPRGPTGGYTGSGALGYSGSTGSGFVGSRGAGDVGYFGSVGYVGSVGSLGFTGSIGSGFAGSQGAPGIPGGYTGSGGTEGFIGSQGIPGSPGGYTGSGGQGPVGLTGSTGAGFTGSGGPGFTGSRGFSGSVGPKGESSFIYSLTVPTSPIVGDRWFDSNSGRELVYVNDGDTSQWVEVAAGRVGFIGSQGQPGIPGGYSGSRGATGFGGLGFTGSSGGGFTGSSGAFAALGYTGSLGASGSLGYSGSVGSGFTGSAAQGFSGSGGLGFTGSIGSTGSRGFSGSAGAGFVGSQGAAGSLGYNGSQGAGFTGSNGEIGPLGFIGSRGTSGFIGSRGIDGYFGSVGTLGYTGSGGTAGINGTVGFVGSRGSASLAWTYNVKNYGATGNGSAVTADMTAETAAIQSAINAAQTNGGTVFFPAGTYRINSSLNITTNDQDPAARPHLLGEGAGGSAIVQTAAANGITVTGSPAVPGTYVTIQGLTLIGNQQGAGLSFADSAFAHVSDVHITNWATGIYGIDVLSMTFEKVIIRFNTNGFRFERSATGTFRSNPNAITMIGCVVGNNTTYGGWIIGAGTFNYIGGSIESNASGTAESASNWGLRITDPGGDVVSESSVGFSLQGVYFEANGGRSNFWIEATEANTGVVGAITGCSFNRISTAYSTNHIRCEASNSAYGFPIAVVGCGFRGLDGYIASVIRPNIFNGSNYFAVNPISCKASSTTDAYVVPVPITTNSVGTPGMITSDSSYMYICAADSRWYRYALATF